MNTLDWYSGEPMTKRELLAAIIMSGGWRAWGGEDNEQLKRFSDRDAEQAVRQADALIERCKRP